MPRATRVIAAADHPACAVVDTVILKDAQRSARDRHRRQRHCHHYQSARNRAAVAGVSGLAQLAWHLGDRHVAVQVQPNRIRVQRDLAVETLLRSLGAKLTMIDAPFEPEGDAYTSSHGHDHHDHAHHDDHVHDHHHNH